MSYQSDFPRGRGRSRVFFLGFLVLQLAVGTAVAQEDEEEEEKIEEIVTVGSQIKGANIRDALAVTVVSAEDIADLGVDSGDQLLSFIAEQGENFFSEAENISGGVNSARGDVGAFNLRNLGTGNTLVLLNGRRVVNSATYQTELVGGSFIPVNTANSQTLPVFGLERVEILKEGASAVYGADAVAGVVNYVMKDDFDGFSIQARYADFEGISRNDHKLILEWGTDFNDGRTNIGVFGSFYHRDPVFAQEDPRWANSDHRWKIPEGSPFEGDTAFRRDSANGRWGQFDVISSVSGITTPVPVFDGSGEFQMLPADDPRCDWAYNQYACGAVDSSANSTPRHNLNENRDLYSDLDRLNLFVLLNHDFGNGLESYTELSAYWSDTVLRRHRSTRLSAVANYEVAADAYYNPLGPCTSPNRLPFDVIGDDTNGGVPCTGLALSIDLYGWEEAPRIVNNDGDMFRVVQGFRGQLGEWDWDTGIVWSRATKADVTKDRISNTLMQQALNDPTAAGYNPFTGGYDTNIEQALINVRRDNETELTLVDFKISTAELFNLWAGPIGFLAGVEWREESFVDDRDPRLDGTIQYVDNDGNGFPIVSDVMNSSPTLDSKGSRDVVSAFAEFQVPLHDRLDMQLALRYEDFSDVGDTTVGKIAMGWRPWDPFLIRGSWSEAYRVPNLVTVNESGVARSNTVDDRVCEYVESFNPDPANAVFDCSYGVQRAAGGSKLLVPEESENTSIGVVWDLTDHLTITVDWWAIQKDKTIGLFGEENHTALELLGLIQAGTSNCPSAAGPSIGNAAVIRDNPWDPASEEAALYAAAGICNVGEAQRVNDLYANLDTRKLRGHDIGVYYERETAIGDFDLRYVGSKLDRYEQRASGPAQQLINAQEAGILPPDVTIIGFANLIRQDGNPRWKHTARLGWRMGNWGAAITGTKVSDVIETRAGLGSDGSPWIIKPMKTFNVSVDYRFNTFGDTNARVRFGAVNVSDTRAPLSTQYFGYLADLHTDLPRSWYIDLKLDF